MIPKFLQRQINQLDPTSDEFFQLYKAIVERYWLYGHPAPNEDFEKRRVLQACADGGEDFFVDVLARVASQIFDVVELKQKASHGAFEVEGKKVYFDIYSDRSQLAALAEQLKNVAVVKAKEEGIIQDPPPETPPPDETCEP